VSRAGTTRCCRCFAPGALIIAALLFGAFAAGPTAQAIPDRVRWSVPLAAPPEGAPVVAGAALVLPLQNGSLSAHALRSGSEIWTAGLRATQPIAGDSERVYVASDDAVHALTAHDGRTAWQVSAGGPVTAALLAHAGWLVVAAAGELLAIRGADGTIVWRQAVGAIEFRPSLDGDLLVVSIADGRVAALDVVSGAKRWEVNLGAAPAEPLAIGGRVYVGTDDKWFHVLHASNGRRDWRWAGPLVRGRAAVDDRHVYVAAMDNVLRAYDRTRGALRWNQGLPYRPAAGPAVLGGGVTVPGYVDSLPVFRPTDGSRAGQIRFAAALTALPVFSTQDGGAPMVFAMLGSLLDEWTLTLLEASLVPELTVTPLKELPGAVVPMPPPPEG
jgi:outer membrane protein assembly factor BamB